MAAPILEQLARGPVLGDGGYVFILKQRGVPMEDYTPYGVLSHADAVKGLYAEFFQTGVDVIQAQTFQGTRNRLERIGQAAHYEDIHRRAVALAREVTGNRVLLAGSVGSAIGSYGLEKAGLTPDALRAVYREECALLSDLGVDFLILETLYFLHDALSALEAAKRTSLAVMATMSCKPRLESRDGFQMDDCARRLKEAGADIVGLNCMQDPGRMFPLLEKIRSAVDGPVAAQPVAVRCGSYTYMGESGRPWTENVLAPETMADFARRAKAIGIDYIGSCCGSGPPQVRAMAEALGKPSRK